MSEADEKLNQVRWYAKSALNGFDTLDPEDAIGNAKADLAALLAYLEPRMTSHPAEAATREIAPYGHCPTCHAKGVSRERRPDGNDKCENGHIYPSRNALCFLSTHQQQGGK